MTITGTQAGGELARLSAEARRARARALSRLVTATRQHRDLPDGLSDVQVLQRLADEIEAGDAQRVTP